MPEFDVADGTREPSEADDSVGSSGIVVTVDGGAEPAGGVGTDDQERCPPFKERLNRLFDTIRPDGGQDPFTNKELAEKVGRTPTYIGYLRSGERDDPGIRTVARIEDFFGVPSGYLTLDDPDFVNRVNRQLDILGSLREEGVLQFAMDAAKIKTPTGRKMLEDMVAAVLTLESRTVDQGTDEPTPGAG